MKEAIIYLLAIAIAEMVTVLVQPVLGIGCHIMILVVVILHTAIGLASKPRLQQLVLSLALVPLVRILSVSMPLSHIPLIWWFLIIYTPLLAAAIMIVRILGCKRGDVGLSFGFLPVQLVVAFSGFIFGVTEYFILRPKPMIIEFSWQKVCVPALILLVSTGFVEELIFRGVMQHAAQESFGWWGVVYVSLLFSILHMGFLSWIDVVFVFVAALFFGWTVKKTGSLLGVTLSHGIANIVLYLVAPFFF